METWRTWEYKDFLRGMFEFVTKAFAMLYAMKLKKDFDPETCIEKMAEMLHKHSNHPIEECREQARLCWDRNVRECEEFLRKEKR